MTVDSVAKSGLAEARKRPGSSHDTGYPLHVAYGCPVGGYRPPINWHAGPGSPGSSAGHRAGNAAAATPKIKTALPFSLPNKETDLGVLNHGLPSTENNQ